MHRWYWRAVYNDGTGISQLEINPETGLEYSSLHADMSKLVAIVMEPRDGKSNRVILQVGEGEKPIRFWRQYVFAMGPKAGQGSTCWVLGLEKNGVGVYAFFRPDDGSVVISTDFNGGSEFQVPKDERLEALARGQSVPDQTVKIIEE